MVIKATYYKQITGVAIYYEPEINSRRVTHSAILG